jgi:hypothetical protein
LLRLHHQLPRTISCGGDSRGCSVKKFSDIEMTWNVTAISQDGSASWRLYRVLQLMRHIADHRLGVSFDDLAAYAESEFAISSRTLRRDLAVMAVCGLIDAIRDGSKLRLMVNRNSILEDALTRSNMSREKTPDRKIRFRCPEHGPTTWETCIQCDAEAALARRLLKERRAIRYRTESTQTNDVDEG